LKKKDHPYNFDVNFQLGIIATSTLDYKNAPLFQQSFRTKKITTNEKLTFII
jgi:hypothetical protein